MNKGQVVFTYKAKKYIEVVDYTRWHWTLPYSCDPHTHGRDTDEDGIWDRWDDCDSHHFDYYSGVCSECGHTGNKIYERTIEEPDFYNASFELTYFFSQPYIQMTENPVYEDTPQKLVITRDGERLYSTKDVTVTVATNPPTPTPPTPTPPDNPPYVIMVVKRIFQMVYIIMEKKKLQM